MTESSGRNHGPASEDSSDIHDLWLDFQLEHRPPLEIPSLEADFDLARCDAWARGVLEDLRKSPDPKWLRESALWIPDLDLWMTDVRWEAWAEAWLSRHPSMWTTSAASILLRPDGKPEHRRSAKIWAEDWLAKNGHDADCYQEILLPFAQEIEGLDESLDITTWQVMVPAWNAGDRRWKSQLQSAVFGYDSMMLDYLVHPGMRRSFWEDLFSPDQLDRIRLHLLEWTRREPVRNLRWGLEPHVHLAVVMGWTDVLESVAVRSFLPGHLGFLDLPLTTHQADHRSLLENFGKHLKTLQGRNPYTDRLELERLARDSRGSLEREGISHALFCAAAEAFRPWMLPLFARAIARKDRWHDSAGVFQDTLALAVGWSRLRPARTLGESPSDQADPP